MAAKKKVIVRKAEANLLIDTPKLVVKAEKIDDDLLLIDDDTCYGTVLAPTAVELLERIQTLEARLNKSELYAQNLSSQYANLRMNVDRLGSRIVVNHTGGMIRTSAT